MRGVALLLYREIYRGWGKMMRNLQSDRASDPAIDDYMRANTDVAFDALADQLAAGFGARGKKAERVRALARLAIDFWTWSRLDAEGLSDEQAAELMADSVSALAARAARRRS